MWGFVIISLLNMKKLILIILLAFVIPSVSSASFDVSLKYGSRGVAVEELQDFLQDQGLYLGKIDGKLGLGTVRAIKLFQSANSLKPDGYFGLASRTKAKILLANSLKESEDSEKAETGVVTPPVKEVSEDTKELLKRVDELQAKVDAQTQVQQQIVNNTRPNVAIPMPPPIRKGTLIISGSTTGIEIALRSYTPSVGGLEITKSPSNLRETKRVECHEATRKNEAVCHDIRLYVSMDNTPNITYENPYEFTVVTSGQTFNFEVKSGDSKSIEIK